MSFQNSKTGKESMIGQINSFMKSSHDSEFFNRDYVSSVPYERRFLACAEDLASIEIDRTKILKNITVLSLINLIFIPQIYRNFLSKAFL